MKREINLLSIIVSIFGPTFLPPPVYTKLSPFHKWPPGEPLRVCPCLLPRLPAEQAAEKAKNSGDNPRSLHKRHVARLSQMQIDESVMAMLGPEERKVLSMVLTKHSEEQKAAKRVPNRAAQMKYAHYSQTPTHKGLMEMPQVFDLKFSHRTIKLPQAVLSARNAPTSQAGETRR